jgi:ornithine cyclodeaminase/alanine dehydrogenase-like protein (mu-crystallin family)
MMTKNRLLYLSQAGIVAAGLPMAEIIDAVEIAFKAKGEGRTEMPPSQVFIPAAATTLSMPCRLTSRT